MLRKQAQGPWLLHSTPRMRAMPAVARAPTPSPAAWPVATSRGRNPSAAPEGDIKGNQHYSGGGARGGAGGLNAVRQLSARTQQCNLPASMGVPQVRGLRKRQACCQHKCHVDSCRRSGMDIHDLNRLLVVPPMNGRSCAGTGGRTRGPWQPHGCLSWLTQWKKAALASGCLRCRQSGTWTCGLSTGRTSPRPSSSSPRWVRSPWICGELSELAVLESSRARHAAGNVGVPCLLWQHLGPHASGGRPSSDHRVCFLSSAMHLPHCVAAARVGR
jgi:hypothetical protein